MSKVTRPFLLAALAAGLLLPGGAKADAPRAVIELFTSQGCSSCPPADALLKEMAKESDLIALSLHVDYWDYLGWKDTLSQPQFTERQRAYAGRRHDGQVYTPQAVVNGTVHALGSDRAAIERAITKSRDKFGALRVPVTLKEAGDKVTISVEGDVPDGSVLWLLSVASAESVAIARGENKGRDMAYTNVVHHVTKVGKVTGRASFDVPSAIAKPAGCDGYVALLQVTQPSGHLTILGAAKGGSLVKVGN